MRFTGKEAGRMGVAGGKRPEVAFSGILVLERVDEEGEDEEGEEEEGAPLSRTKYSCPHSSTGQL